MPGPPDRGAEPDPLGSLEERLGHRYARRPLLEQALTHRSRAHEAGGGGPDNERLEFLGDAVLDLVVAALLMARHPAALEGVLARARASVVNKQALAARARAIGLDQLVRLGRGEGRSAGREKASILANVFESVLGALYLGRQHEFIGHCALVHRQFSFLVILIVEVVF